jgi:hypothetical protein
MAKLHELLAAEKTPTAAWNQLYEDTLKKFKNPQHFFNGHSKSLKMINDSAENSAVEDQNRDEKPVTTTVVDTLEYALDIFARAEDLQYQKNMTNTRAFGTVNFRGQPLLVDLSVDELLGLEARLMRLRQLFAEMPTLDATKEWVPSPLRAVWALRYPEETVKTEKIVVPIVMSPATDKHPAQVQAVGKDVVVGKFTLVKRSGEATAQQKADMLKLTDELMVEVKQARMRANETVAVTEKIADKVIHLLLAPLHESE